MDLKDIFGHVQDGKAFHFPHHMVLELPKIFGFQITKFMVLELIAALLMCLLFIPLARRMRNGEAPKGRTWNLLEALLLFLRDQVARPSIGHDADRFLPFIWSIFFFVLFCNLLGILPWCGSPTGAMATTATMAVMTFGAVLFAGMQKHGVAGFVFGLVPHIDVPGALGIVLKPILYVMLLGIEVLGLLIKHSVLAVRLLANMFAGHLVLAVIVAFIGATASSYLAIWLGVTVGSVLGAVALNMLELFVAFLQAYIFAFLSALFIGMAIHQH